jgi:hypothetical protein
MSHHATNWAIQQRGLKPALKVVLWHLADRHHRDNGCFPSQDTLADDCEVPRSTLNVYLDELERRGLIARERRRIDGSQKMARTRYYFPFEAEFTRFSTEKPSPETGHGADGGAESRNRPEPCPENGESRVQNLDSNPVREPGREPEREGACATSENDRKKVEREFDRWLPTWPTYPNGSKDAARAAWFELTAEERAACIAKTPAFIAVVKERKAGKFTYPAVYLKERAWERLEDPRSDVAPPTMHNPFSRAWMALRLSELLKPMASAWPVMTAFQRMKAAESAEAAKAVEMERREKYGWPKVNTLHELATNAKGALVLPELQVISEGFVKVHRDSELAMRWKAMHARHGWPWLPLTGHEWLYFPEGEPEEAMAEFQTRLNDGKSNDA